uniref:GGDEF domain-containing protein n=1 Tax=uncultured Thiotrichaceae bacterium TaxID=298394 RepID=A0A6S6U740_9GAMM|nr:MAG: Unknown protein [uncultured Thiotrichaceae bacterium]
MKKYPLQSNSSSLTSVALGLVLVLGVALATANLLSTYKGIHQQKQATIWNIIQLDREIGDTLFDAQQYISGHQNPEVLRERYEALRIRFPATISGIKKDEIFQQVRGLSDSIHTASNHVKSAENMMISSSTIDTTSLNQWARQLNEMKKQINEQVLDNIASTDSEYSDRAFNTILKTASFLLILLFAFILYLVNLLIELRKERNHNLYTLAHDTLTGLHSRNYVMTTLQSRCDKKKPFAVVMFDLNKFKVINDTFGHHVGDQLLIHLAETFKQTLSKFGTIGRMGGDEFLWITESDNPQIIQQQYTLFLNKLKGPCVINQKRLYIYVSAGGVIAADHEYHTTKLLEHSDEAMYQAKTLKIKDIFWENTTSPAEVNH